MSAAIPVQSARLPSGGAIDRSKPLTFSFNGQSYTGFQGDTLASALLANEVRMVGRSFKFHRPRGIFSAGEEEPCALLEIGSGAGREPNARATLVPLSDGLEARTQNVWPSLGFDVGRAFDYSHFLWPAGFYNKTFKWPNWHVWEGLIRRAAGMGRAPEGPDPDHYEQVNAHCDLLVCGGGPSGLTAALFAGRAGARVILADQDEMPGGCLNWEHHRLDAVSGAEWARNIAKELEGLPNVIVLPRSTVAGCYDHNVTTLLQRGKGKAWRECFWTVRPKQVLLATGAIEQGMIFRNNDRPGIMLAGAVRQYVNRYAVLPGRKVIIATNNDTAYQLVLDLKRHEIQVLAVVDCRAAVDPALRQRLGDVGTELICSARIADTRGDRAIREVTVERLDGTQMGRRACDLLAISGGWSPRLHLYAHARGRIKFNVASQAFVPDQQPGQQSATAPANFSVIGSANGTVGIQQCLSEARAVAGGICERLGLKAATVSLPRIEGAPISGGEVQELKLDIKKPRQWIDLAHDVVLSDAELAVREGYVSVEHFKRYTTTGMSVDQGKTGNLNAFTVLGQLTGRATGDVGTTTFRPPYMPVTLGAIAGPFNGDFYSPRRLLPAHVVHQRLNACFLDFGSWQRPECYPVAGESHIAAIRREVLAVRRSVGVFDNSPIGKIEVRGPDAAEFLNRMYINNVKSLARGRARYGLMLNDNGIIIDDGVFVRLDAEGEAGSRYLVHTTSSGVGRIHELMEELLQCEWPDMRVLVDDVTTQWANFTVAGPRARDLIRKLGTDIDLSREKLPHMATASGKVMGLEARIVRVSFSGELSFEINIPARAAQHFLQTVLVAGKAFDITPYGIEALMVLRTEKGYLHVGSETDGSSTPDDVGWGHVARAKAADFIGKRSLYRAGNRDEDRKQFIGLEPLDPKRAIVPGSHLLIGAGRQPPAHTDGWVTSACFSPNLDRHIALAVLRGGQDREGEVVTVINENERFDARVVPSVFFDPADERLNG